MVVGVAALAVASCSDTGGPREPADGGSDTGDASEPADGGSDRGDFRGSGGTDPNDADPDAVQGERGGSNGSGGDGYVYMGLGRASPPDGAFTDVSAGVYVTCGVRGSGEIECWGDSIGEVPDGVFKQVSVHPHGAFACALAAGGQAMCWGDDVMVVAGAPEGEFVDVSAGGLGACAVISEAALVCWGGRLRSRSLPEGSFVSVQVGDNHLCTLDIAGAVVCWGAPGGRRRAPDAPTGAFVEVSAGASGSDRRDPGVDYACGLRVSGLIECWAAPFGEGFDFGQADPPGGEFVALSAGGEHACAIGVEGRVVCWGNNDTHQVDPVGEPWGWSVNNHSCSNLPDFDWHPPSGAVDCEIYRGSSSWEPLTEDHPYWASPEYWGVHGGAPDPLLGPFVQVSAGVKHTCAVRFDAALVCWGAWMEGFEVLEGAFSEVALGAAHGCALRVGGEAVCWGIGPDDEGWAGQTEAPAGQFTQISAGDDHTCGLRTGGAVACWGDDHFGQVDAPAGEFVQVTAVGGSSCGLRTDGVPTCWGAVAALRPPPGEFTSVTAAGRLGRPCGIRPDHSVVCWGYGPYGEPPAWVGPLVDVSLGHPVSCGVQASGSVVCWDNNTKADTYLVVGTSPPVGRFVQVTSSGRGYCAVSVGGALACVDFGHLPGNGVLGYGVLDASEGEFVKVSAGAEHVCGIRTDATVACWGSDGYVVTPEPSGP